jgi:hypothetical protein
MPQPHSSERRPELSVVVPTRGGLREVEPALEALMPEAEAVRIEVVVVGRIGADERAPSECVRLVPTATRDMLELHKRGIEESPGRRGRHR